MPNSVEPITTLVAPVYRYYLVDIISNNLVGEVPFLNVSFDKSLKNAGNFSGSISINTETEKYSLYDSTMPGRTSLYVTRNGVCVWGGIIWSRNYDLVNRSLSIQASEFTSYFNHRVIWKDYSYDFGATLSRQDQSSYVYISIDSRVLKSPLPLTDGYGNPTKVRVNFVDTKHRKYSGDYEVKGESSNPAARVDPGLVGFYVDIPNLPSGTYSNVGVTAYIDTYEYLRELIRNTFDDFINVQFPNEIVNPGIKTGLKITYKKLVTTSSTYGIATITTEKPHGLFTGQRVELYNVDELLDGFHTISAIPSQTTFQFILNNAVSQRDFYTLLDLYDIPTTAVDKVTELVSRREISTEMKEYVTHVEREYDATANVSVITLYLKSPHRYRVGDKIVPNLDTACGYFKVYNKSKKKNINTNTLKFAENNKVVTAITDLTVQFEDTTYNDKKYNITKQAIERNAKAKNYINASTGVTQLKLYIRNENGNGYSLGDKVTINGVDDGSWTYPIYNGFHSIFETDAGNPISVYGYQVIAAEESDTDSEDDDSYSTETSTFLYLYFKSDTAPYIPIDSNFYLSGITNSSHLFLEGKRSSYSDVESPVLSISSISRNGTYVTYTVVNGNPFSAGMTVTITDATTPAFNGTYTVFDTPTSNTFRIASTASGGTSTASVSSSELWRIPVRIAEETSDITFQNASAYSPPLTLGIYGSGWISYLPGETADAISAIQREPNNSVKISRLSYKKKIGAARRRVTITTPVRHNLNVGDEVSISFSGSSEKSDNALFGGKRVISSVGDYDTFTYNLPKDQESLPKTNIDNVAKSGVVERKSAKLGDLPLVEINIDGIRAVKSGNASEIIVHATDHDLVDGEYVSINYSKPEHKQYDTEDAVKINVIDADWFSYISNQGNSDSIEAKITNIDYRSWSQNKNSAIAQINKKSTVTFRVKGATTQVTSNTTTANISSITINSATKSATFVTSSPYSTFGGTSNYSVTNAVGNGSTVTYTVSGTPTFYVGQEVKVVSVSPSVFNGDKLEVSAVTSNTVTVVSNAVGVFSAGSSGNAKIMPGDGNKVTIASLPDTTYTTLSRSNLVAAVSRVEYDHSDKAIYIYFSVNHGLDQKDDTDAIVTFSGFTGSKVNLIGTRENLALKFLNGTKKIKKIVTDNCIKIDYTNSTIKKDWAAKLGLANFGTPSATIQYQPITRVLKPAFSKLNGEHYIKSFKNTTTFSIQYESGQIPDGTYTLAGSDFSAGTTTVVPRRVNVTSTPTIVAGDLLYVTGLIDKGDNKYSILNKNFSVLYVASGGAGLLDIYVKNTTGKIYSDYAVVENAYVSKYQETSATGYVDYSHKLTGFKDITLLSRSASSPFTTVTVTCVNHGVTTGDYVNIYINNPGMSVFNKNNEPVQVTYVDDNTFTYSLSPNPSDVQYVSISGGYATLYFKNNKTHNFVVGDVVSVSGFTGTDFTTGTKTITSVGTYSITFASSSTKRNKTVLTGTVTPSTMSTISNRSVNGFMVECPSIVKEGTAYLRTYGEFPGNSDLGGISFSTEAYSNLASNNSPVYGGQLETVNTILDKYTNGTNGFDYRIDCYANTDANGRTTFSKVFRMIPIKPDSLKLYLSSLLNGELAQNQVIPLSALGADRIVFQYPGNISSISYAENAADSATRVFVSTSNNPTGGDSSVTSPYSAASDYKLLKEGWPILDKKETVDWPIQPNGKILGYDTETDLYYKAEKYLKEARPPFGTLDIGVNGSLDPVYVEYSPGDWCSIVIEDDFLKNRTNSSLELREDVLVRKIDTISVSVPNSPFLPEEVTLTLVNDWQVDYSGE